MKTLAGSPLLVLLLLVQVIWGAGTASAGEGRADRVPSYPSVQTDGENLYPDPIERRLARVRHLEDRVVVVFRELCETRVRAEGSSGVASLLVDALLGHHRLLSWQLRRLLEEEASDGPAHRRLAALLSEPDLPQDRAAFEPALQALDPRDTSLAAFRESIEAEARALDDPTQRALYVEHARARPDFHAKRHLWHRIGQRVADSLDGLVDRLRTRFDEENLLRFFHRVAHGRILGEEFPEPVRRRARDMKERLAGSLLEEIRRDFEDRARSGLATQVRSIELIDGGVVIKSSLTSGRLRRFLKYLEPLRGTPDLALFLPLLSRTIRAIRGFAASPEGRSCEHARRVVKTLETMELVYRMSPSGSGAAPGSFPLAEAIRTFLAEADEDGLFR